MPLLAITIVPIASLGACYMVANQPLFWAIQSEKFGGPMNQLKVIIRGVDLNFYQTDEIDLKEIAAAVQREREAEDEFYEQAQAKEDARYEEECWEPGFFFSRMRHDLENENKWRMSYNHPRKLENLYAYILNCNMYGWYIQEVEELE